MNFKFTIPGSDTGCRTKLDQFKTGFEANWSRLGYTNDDNDEVGNAADEFSSKLTTSNAARDAAQAAVSAKDAAKVTSSSTIRTWAQRVKNNPAATPEILAEMGLTPASAPVGPVTIPTGLSANASASGTCTLRWGSNGNTPTTTYVLEAAVDGGFWQWLGSTTKKSFTDGGATPGVPKLYRVRAQRAGVTSSPSEQAGIYGGEDGVTLSLAA